MHVPRPTPLLATLLLFSAPSLYAQPAADPSGHWEGKVQAPGFELNFEVDLARNAKGGFAGTISIPAENLKGLPVKVAVTGSAIRFLAREDQPFNGYLSDDGKSMTGDLITDGYSIPLSMTRTGDARIEAPARSAAIGKELEGTWNGTVEVGGTKVRLVLTMANQPDGTSTGSVVNVDQGKLEIPASTITQTASNLTLDFKAVGASYAGALNKEGTELVGTYRQGGLAVPVTFQHAAADGKK